MNGGIRTTLHSNDRAVKSKIVKYQSGTCTTLEAVSNRIAIINMEIEGYFLEKLKVEKNVAVFEAFYPLKLSLFGVKRGFNCSIPFYKIHGSFNMPESHIHSFLTHFPFVCYNDTNF